MVVCQPNPTAVEWVSPDQSRQKMLSEVRHKAPCRQNDCQTEVRVLRANRLEVNSLARAFCLRLVGDSLTRKTGILHLGILSKRMIFYEGYPRGAGPVHAAEDRLGVLTSVGRRDLTDATRN
jgi:hypothetical protein